MVHVAHRVHYSVADYLAFEETTDAKHEYLEGQIYAMAGGTPEHAALSSAFAVLVGPQLAAGRCRTFSSDLRVGISETSLITYPDAAVICGPVERDPNAASVVTNPVLLLEVLSPSTREYDRTDKLDHYRHLKSLRQYVLVDPRGQTVELRTLGEDGAWSTKVYQVGEVASLDSVGARLDVRHLFATAAEPSA